MAEAYRSYDFLMIANSSEADPNYNLAAIKGFFQSENIEYCHDYHGNAYSTWSKLGADGYIPFNVVIDRDGMVRKVGGAATSADWETLIKELCGAP